MFTPEDLAQRFSQAGGPTTETPGVYPTVDQGNPNNPAQAVPDSGANNNDAESFANNFKMQQANTLQPVEDDGTIRPSQLR